MITVEHLHHRFSHPVLDDVSFHVSAGEVVGYLGPNGAGKTTTLRILCGMLMPDDGTVLVAGHDPRTEPIEVRSRLGYVPESGALYEALTPLEFLTMVGRLHELAVPELERRAQTFLEMFGLWDERGERMTTFSKGMKQKVVITSALIHDPQILFLDEPLNGLDAGATVTVKEIVRAMAARGRAVLYSSHLMDVVERVSDRVIILDEGRIVADGDARELRESSGDASLEALFNRLTGDEDVQARTQSILEMFDRPATPPSGP